MLLCTMYYMQIVITIPFKTSPIVLIVNAVLSTELLVDHFTSDNVVRDETSQKACFPNELTSLTVDQ